MQTMLVGALFVVMSAGMPSTPNANRSVASLLPSSAPFSTAEIFVINAHFENSGYFSLDHYTDLLQRLKDAYGASKLPRSLVWRIAPPAIRGDNHHPSVNENIQAMVKIASLYPSTAQPRMVFYPDVETESASLWGTSAWEQAEIKADPTKATFYCLPVFACTHTPYLTVSLCPYLTIIAFLLH